MKSLKSMNPLARKVASISAVVALACLLFALYITTWAKPNQADFKTARADVKTIQDSTAPLQEALQTYVKAVQAGSEAGKMGEALKSESADEYSAYEKVLSGRLAVDEKLKKSKVLRDQDVKKAYDTYAAQEANFVQYATDYPKAYRSFVSSSMTCMDILQLSRDAGVEEVATQHRNAAKDCLVDLNAMTTESSVLRDYANKFKNIVNERQKNFDGIADGSIKPEVGYPRIEEVTNQIGTNDPVPAINTATGKARFDKQLTDLAAVLDKKAAEQ